MATQLTLPLNSTDLCGHEFLLSFTYAYLVSRLFCPKVSLNKFEQLAIQFLSQ